MSLTDSLNQILEWHQKNHTPAGRLLQPGLSEDEIRAKLAGLPFSLPRELVALYEWRNGTAIGEEGEDTSLFEIHRFLPLEEALENFQEVHPEAKETYELSDWMQVFQDATGDGYAVTAAPEDAKHAAVVLRMEDEVQEVFSSLTRMMQTVAAAFAEGAMGWEDEEMETDFFAWGELAHRLDPGIAYWKRYVEGEE